MVGLHPGFSAEAGGGPTLELHGLTEGSMLEAGHRNVGRFLLSIVVSAQAVFGVFLSFSMSPRQVPSSKIRSPLKEGLSLLVDERDCATLVAHLRCV